MCEERDPHQQWPDHEEVHGGQHAEDEAHCFVVPEVAEAIADRRPERQVLTGSRWSSWGSHPGERDGRNREGRGIEPERQPDAEGRARGRGNDHAGQCRTDEPDELGGAHDDGVAGLEVVTLYQRRDDAVLSGYCEAGDQAEPECECVEHPHLDGAGEDGCCHRRGEHTTDDVGDEHHPSWRDPVGDRAADEHEQGAGDSLERQHDPQRERVTGQLEDQPRRGDQRELIAEHRGRGAGQQQTEVTKRQDPTRRSVCRRRPRRCGGAVGGEFGVGHELSASSSVPTTKLPWPDLHTPLWVDRRLRLAADGPYRRFVERPAD